MTAREEPDQWIVVRNWTKHQHYKDRWVPWIKFYPELLHDPAYTRLPDSTRLLLCQLWLEYASTRAQLPLDTRWLSRQLTQKVTRRQLKTLADAGFLTFESRPNLDHVYMNSRPTRAREEAEAERAEEQEQALGQSPVEEGPAPLHNHEDPAPDQTDMHHYLVTNRSEPPPNIAELDIACEFELAKLLYILRDRDDGTIDQLRTASNGLPQAALVKVRESVLRNAGGAGYAINALKAEKRERQHQ